MNANSKIFVSVSGYDTVAGRASKNVLDTFNKTIDGATIADNRVVSRNVAFAVGREYRRIDKVTFYTVDEAGKRAVLATADNTPTGFAIAYTDKKVKGETKPHTTTKSGKFDGGPALESLTHKVLGALGMIDKGKGETTALREKLTAAETAAAAREAEIAELQKMLAELKAKIQ